jgi:hypothetical protein
MGARKDMGARALRDMYRTVNVPPEFLMSEENAEL